MVVFDGGLVAGSVSGANIDGVEALIDFDMTAKAVVAIARVAND